MYLAILEAALDDHEGVVDASVGLLHELLTRPIEVSRNKAHGGNDFRNLVGDLDCGELRDSTESIKM